MRTNPESDEANRTKLDKGKKKKQQQQNKTKQTNKQKPHLFDSKQHVQVTELFGLQQNVDVCNLFSQQLHQHSTLTLLFLFSG